MDSETKALAAAIGQRVRNARALTPDRWRQEELARAAGVSLSYVSMIERGERMPHIPTLQKLATALKVRLGDFFSEPPDPREVSAEAELLQPLAALVKARALKPDDVDKLVQVGRVIFHHGARS